MEIRLGDTIKDSRGREGVLTNIGIATSKTDVAGELGVDAKEYDTDLNYMGAVTFGSNWCYFSDIQEVVKKNIPSENAVDSLINLIKSNNYWIEPNS